MRCLGCSADVFFACCLCLETTTVKGVNLELLTKESAHENFLRDNRKGPMKFCTFERSVPSHKKCFQVPNF